MREALLDLLFVNREGLVGDVKVGGCLWAQQTQKDSFQFLEK